MNNIRKARPEDASRIAEILVFTKRMNYRSIFCDDSFSFNDLQVLPVAQKYLTDPVLLAQTWVYDDGIVKGLIEVRENEIETLDVPMPAVLSTTTSINKPALPGMRAILGAAKKPQIVWSLTDLSVETSATVRVVSTVPPAEPDRKKIVFEAEPAEAAAKLVAALKQDGIL